MTFFELHNFNLIIHELLHYLQVFIPYYSKDRPCQSLFRILIYVYLFLTTNTSMKHNFQIKTYLVMTGEFNYYF